MFGYTGSVQLVNPLADRETPGMTAPDLSSTNKLRRLIVGYRLSQALHVAAKLGIADLLSEGSRSVDDLARATGTHRMSLYRLLRVLASEGVFREQDEGYFALTPLAEPLLSDGPESLRIRAIFDGADGNWSAWGQLLHSIQTGEPAIEHAFGKDIFGYLKDHPQEAKNFNEVMAGQTLAAAHAIVNAYDFSRVNTLVDVGGGVGVLLAAILKDYPSMRGVLYDQSHVVVDAHARLVAAGVVDRCEAVGGDFFESVPAGGDAYILKHILHDWGERGLSADPRELPSRHLPGRTTASSRGPDPARQRTVLR